MIRSIFLCAAFWAAFASFGFAEKVRSPAQVDVMQSGITEDPIGRTELRLSLSHGVPFRVFTLDAPPRLVLDFRTVDWSGVHADALIKEDSGIAALRVGPFQPGWSRLVADLKSPMLPEDVAMEIDETTGKAVLELFLAAASATEFSAVAGTPSNGAWPMPAPQPHKPAAARARFVVALDPGHGGIDPGAERNGVSEKDLMLEIALEMRAALMGSSDVHVVLTRESDIFVSLDQRVAVAQQARADVFVSLHADALSEGGARGATIYTLSEEASDIASAHLAARHNRADIIAGADLTESDDEVALVLLDLARRETEPRSQALAEAFADSMTAAGGPMNRRPLREAGFSVLKSADIPSVLVEVGFLSSPRDLQNLRDPAWRLGMTQAMARAILNWRSYDAAQQKLVRR